MELLAPNFTARWVYPFPEEPETGVQLRKLSDAEVNRIYDKHKYIPGAKTATVSRAAMVVSEMICSSVQDWKGFTQNKVALPCDDANKLLMLEKTMIDEDGEKSTVWNVVQSKFAKMQEEDSKN